MDAAPTPIRTSFVVEALRAGLLVHWQPGWKPYLALATDPHSPWFPTVFGMLGHPTTPVTTTTASQWARELTLDKWATEQLLRRHGFDVPEGRVFAQDEHEDAWRYATSLGGPVVVKPVNGGKGRGVSVGVCDRSRFERAVDRLRRHGFGDTDFLVQRELAGRQYRFNVFRGRVLTVVERPPASVFGDGVSSVVELVEAKNALREELWPEGGLKLVVLDAEALELLADAGLEPSSVPPARAVVQIGRLSSTSSGGDAIELTAQVHPSLNEFVIDVAGSIPMHDLVGIDVILSEDHKLPPDSQMVTVLEVNGGPGMMSSSLAPTAGRAHNFYRMLVEAFAEDAGLRIVSADESSSVVIRLDHMQAAWSEILRQLSGVPLLDVVDAGLSSGDGLRLSGGMEPLYDALNVVRKVAGTVIGVSVAAQDPDDPDWLDRILGPTALLPNDHTAVLSQGMREVER